MLQARLQEEARQRQELQAQLMSQRQTYESRLTGITETYENRLSSITGFLQSLGQHTGLAVPPELLAPPPPPAASPWDGPTPVSMKVNCSLLHASNF